MNPLEQELIEYLKYQHPSTSGDLLLKRKIHQLFRAGMMDALNTADTVSSEWNDSNVKTDSEVDMQNGVRLVYDRILLSLNLDALERSETQPLGT